jgi:hypothetical protein
MDKYSGTIGPILDENEELVEDFKKMHESHSYSK